MSENITINCIEAAVNIILKSSPLACIVCNDKLEITNYNQSIVNIFSRTDLKNIVGNHFSFEPEFQPDGNRSKDKIELHKKTTDDLGRSKFEWLFMNNSKEPIPCEVILTKIHVEGTDIYIAYIRDLREIRNTIATLRQLESIAFTDFLTEVSTRRYFMDKANDELIVSQNLRYPYHILFMDLDYFKQINDNYGHRVGDEVLKITAKRVQSVIRKDTLLARYGGEEFVSMLTNIDYISAVETAERIRNVIKNNPYKIDDKLINITICVGVASKTNEECTLIDIIERADHACYAAKKAGRDQVFEHKNIPESLLKK